MDGIVDNLIMYINIDLNMGFIMVRKFFIVEIINSDVKCYCG